MQLHTHCGCLALEQFAQVIERSAFAIPALNEVPRRPVQLRQALPKGVKCLGFPIRAKALLDLFIQERLQFRVRADRFRAEFPSVIGEQMQRDSPQPRAQRTLGVALGKLPKRYEESLLRKIIRVVPVGKPHSQAGAHARMVPPNQLGKRLQIPSLRGADEVRIGNGCGFRHYTPMGLYLTIVARLAKQHSWQ